MNEKVPVHQQIDSLDDSTAFLIGQSIQDVKRVNDPTRLKIALNLGEILSRYDRSRLHLGDMMAMALDTQNIKAVERLGRFRISPGREPSASTLKNLSHRLHDYVSIITATASLTGDNRSKLLVELFEGTRFSAFEETDDARQSVEEQLSRYLNRYATFIFEKCKVQEYFSESRRYNAVPKPLGLKEREEKKRNYTFEVNHDGWRSTGFPEINLFSKIRSVAEGYYRRVEVDEIPNECKREKCMILGLESIGLGIYPTGASNEPNLVFTSIPSTGIILQENNFTDIFRVIPDHTGIWKYYPFSRNREHFEALSKRHFLLGGSYEQQIEKEMSQPARFILNHYFELSEELDLSWITNGWKQIGGDARLAERRYFGQAPHLLGKNLKRVSASSIRDVFNVSRDSIITNNRSVFQTRFDTSRAISPPDTMIAELEINLWYDGYNTTFDDSQAKDYATMLDYEWDIDENGDEFRREFRPQPFEDTILEQLENNTEELSHAYFEWRNEISLETRERSKIALELTEVRLRQLRLEHNSGTSGD
ncbi:hypothetical protein OAD74_08975 [Alphaproteobacteria bacterium]|nr:hypothetical protein [Alphaproteobacteria bacterium]